MPRKDAAADSSPRPEHRAASNGAHQCLRISQELAPRAMSNQLAPIARRNRDELAGYLPIALASRAAPTEIPTPLPTPCTQRPPVLHEHDSESKPARTTRRTHTQVYAWRFKIGHVYNAGSLAIPRQRRWLKDPYLKPQFSRQSDNMGLLAIMGKDYCSMCPITIHIRSGHWSVGNVSGGIW